MSTLRRRIASLLLLVLALVAVDGLLAVKRLAFVSCPSPSFQLRHRRPHPQLTAAAASPRPPLSRWRATVGGSTWRVGAVTTLICLDILQYSFPLPFMPEYLAARGHTSRQVSQMLSSFSFAALAAGASLVVVESVLPPGESRDATTRCWLLAVAAAAMAAVSAAMATLPSYGAMLVVRSVQGAISQFCWAVGLALAASLPPAFGVAATAWVMTGNSIGEVVGPVYGTALHSLGGLRLPYACASALTALVALAFGASAAAAPRLDISTDRHGGALEANGSSPVVTAAAAEVATSPEQEGEGSPLKQTWAALQDPPTWRLCASLALSCGLVRSCLDILMPLWLGTHHGFASAGIGRCAFCATVCFLLGSTMAGRLLPRHPEATAPLLLGAGLLASLLCASVLLPPSWAGVCALFCAYYGVSAFVCVAATAALEARGQQLGRTDSVMALSVFMWTVGFAGGGAVANLACGGAASAVRQRAVLGAVGALSAAMFAVMGRQEL